MGLSTQRRTRLPTARISARHDEVPVVTTAEQYTDLDRARFFINGAWVEPAGTERHRALGAATEEPLGDAALGADADIDAAVTAARAALDTGPWCHSSPPSAPR
jgi:betaine-aldehyde dehydrogenase